MHQTPLFFELVLTRPPAPNKTARGLKSLVNKLYSVRRELNESEKAGLDILNKAIEDVRILSNSSGTKIEEKILYSIERQGCFTLTEVAETVKLPKDITKEILKTLLGKKLIRKVPRYVPGSDRQYYGIKSNRVDLGEMV